MSADKIRTLLQALGGSVPLSQPRAGWVLSTCPLAPWRHDGGKDKNPSFGARQQAGDARVHCFSCGYSGTLIDLVYTIRHLNKTAHSLDIEWAKVMQIVESLEDDFELQLDGPDIEELLFGGKSPLVEFPGWWLDTFVPWRDCGPVAQYLAKRQVPPAVADALGLRADSKEMRAAFPIHDFDGVCRGLHGRAILPDVDPRYRMYSYLKKNNPLIWLGEHWVDRSKPVVVVEGPFDVASVLRVYRNVVSPLYVLPSQEKLKRMADAFEWITLFDKGKGGDLGRQRISQTLGATHLITHLHPPEGRKDPGEATVEELADLLRDHVPLDPIPFD